MIQSLLLFVLAGLSEIGGGYLFWLWLREGKSIWLAVLGMLVLALYAVLPTLQTANFGSVCSLRGNLHFVIDRLGMAS